jgi:hypothetical protein
VVILDEGVLVVLLHVELRYLYLDTNKASKLSTCTCSATSSAVKLEESATFKSAPHRISSYTTGKRVVAAA